MKNQIQMKNMWILANIILVILFSYSLIFGWGTDTNISNDSYHSHTYYNNAWKVAASGDTVVVVWHRSSGSIWCRVSKNSGSTWDSLIQVYSSGKHPCVATKGSNMYIVWDYDFNRIYFRKSTDWGTTWSSASIINDTTLYGSCYPSIAVSDNNLHVVYTGEAYGGLPEVYYVKSSNAGGSWGSSQMISKDDNWQSSISSISAYGSSVNVAWCDTRDEWTEVYYDYSTNNGSTWHRDQRVSSNDQEYSWFPSISAQGDTVHIVWEDESTSKTSIFYRKTTNYGSSWSTITNLIPQESNNNRHCNIWAKVKKVHVVWHRDTRTKDIYYIRSTNGGSSWLSEQRIGYDDGDSDFPSVTVEKGMTTGVPDVYAVWNDKKDGDYDVYLDKYSSEEKYRDPKVTLLSKNEESLEKGLNHLVINPNLISEHASIRLKLSETKTVSIGIFDACGREVRTIFQGELLPRDYVFEWDCKDNERSDVKPGIYFVKAKGFETRKIVKVR